MSVQEPQAIPLLSSKRVQVIYEINYFLGKLTLQMLFLVSYYLAYFQQYSKCLKHEICSLHSSYHSIVVKQFICCYRILSKPLKLLNKIYCCYFSIPILRYFCTIIGEICMANISQVIKKQGLLMLLAEADLMSYYIEVPKRPH